MTFRLRVTCSTEWARHPSYIISLYLFPLFQQLFQISTFSLSSHSQIIISLPFNQLYKNTRNQHSQLPTTWPINLVFLWPILTSSLFISNRGWGKGWEAPGWCNRLSIRLLVLVQIMISKLGYWDSQAQYSVWSLLEFLSPSSFAPHHILSNK